MIRSRSSTAALLALALGVAPLTLASCGAGGAPDAVATTAVAPSDTVRVVTDRFGIPHVRARTLADLYYGWGWVTARDRLWQLEHTRRAARGELWEWFGNSKLRDDGGAQLFELAARARRSWVADSANAEVRTAIEAYAAGVNARIAECRRGEAAWPPELRDLERTPADWTAEDCYLIPLAQAMVLDFDLPELGERDAVAKHGQDGMTRRRRFEGELAYTTIPDSAALRLWGDAPVETEAAATLLAPAAPGRDLTARARAALGSWLVAQDPESRASNFFAVGAGRSRSGAPLLANDPHLPLSAPAALHVIHLSLEGGFDAIGAYAPGLPILATGRNRDCAWGVTSLAADVVDVYADTLSADGKRVRANGEWVAIREEPFAMKFRLPGGALAPLVGQKRRYGPHGPIVIHDRKQRVAYGVRWAGYDETWSLAGVLGLERATSAGAIADRVRTLRTPCFNFAIADARGRVIYQVAGAVPRRGFTPPWGPLPGDGAHEWAGVLAPEELPRWEPPSRGWIVNGNNLPARAPGLEPWPRYEWSHDRAWRMDALLATAPAGGLGLDDLATIQNDLFSRGAERFVPRLLRLAQGLRESGRLDARAAAALDTLAAWDFVAARGRVAPALYRGWLAALDRQAGTEGLHGLIAAALDGRAPEALGRVTPEAAAAAGLDTALVRLRALLGDDLPTWTWERAHQARFRHRVDAKYEPALVPADGDNSTVSVGRSHLPWNVEFGHGPVFRHVVDLAIPDSSLGIVTPGNHGEPGHPHAHDLAPLWADHRYVPFLMSWDRIAAHLEDERVLAPR